jgi:GH24 family phage-related lysozyme (muramidase)
MGGPNRGSVRPAEEVTANNIFATVTKAGKSLTVDETTSLTSGFSSLTEAEGTDIHLDGRGYVTLPYGIVPDKNSVKKADGTTFDPTGSHGLTSSGLSGVDYSGATKFGISRTDYDTDEAFAKAVYAEFGSRTATKYGEGFDDLTEEAKQAAYDMAWNAGIGAASWSSVKTMLKEASKEGEKSKDSLIGFTTNFKSGTDYPRGLLKRRLQTYNLVANEGEEASTITTSASMTDGARTGTIYTVKAADGTVLKTWSKPDTNEVIGDLEVPQ